MNRQVSEGLNKNAENKGNIVSWQNGNLVNYDMAVKIAFSGVGHTAEACPEASVKNIAK